MRLLGILALIGMLSVARCAGEKYSAFQPLVHQGTCDASAAVAVSSNLFLMASDENNVLRLYRNDRSGPALQEYDMNAFLEVEGKFLEADIEGAAKIGDRVFWIGSHGRNRTGKERLNRSRFFATDIRLENGRIDCVPIGRPCKTLLEGLVADPRFRFLNLGVASTRAPKERDALDIEGLSATPEGHLLIGFRNPLYKGTALVIPLLNPNDVLQGQTPRFGDLIRLDLGGLGIRDIAYQDGQYLIVAGPYDGRGRFKLYRWAGPGVDPVHIKSSSFGDLHPEAVILYPEFGFKQVQLLSDDGMRDFGDVPCKQLASGGQFRSVWLNHKGAEN